MGEHSTVLIEEKKTLLLTVHCMTANTNKFTSSIVQ